MSQSDSGLEEYLQENNIDAKKTESGLYINKTKTTDGEMAQPGDVVQVHYTGRLLDGSEFDSSRKRGKAFSFKLGQGRVIKGWDEGIAMLREGETATLYIPSELGYGTRGSGRNIPPNSDLIFEVELLSIFDPEKQKVKEAEDINDYLAKKGWEAKTLENGLRYVQLEKGKGDVAQKGEIVKVHYKGKLIDESIFDSSYDRGEPIQFVLGQGKVIPGWEIALQQMKQGEKGVLLIPSHLGYGTYGAGQVIPPNATLIFEMELIEITSEEEIRNKELEEIQKYLKNKGLDAETFENGLAIAVTEKGKGAAANPGDTVLVHYTGKLLEGTKFDSSKDRGKPFEFVLGQGKVIKGWDLGVAKLQEGDKATLVIPSWLGYGSRGAGATIPPNATLVFDIELIEVK